MSPRPKHQLAREHLARGQDGILTQDLTEAVTWRFLSLEAAIVSVADEHGIGTENSTGARPRSQKEMFDSGVLAHNFSATLRVINEARKVVTYEGDEPDLDGQSIEDIAADVEAAVEEAEEAASA